MIKTFFKTIAGFASQFKIYLVLGAIILGLLLLCKSLYLEKIIATDNLDQAAKAYEYSLEVTKDIAYQEGLNKARAEAVKIYAKNVKKALDKRGAIDEENNDNSLYSIIKF